MCLAALALPVSFAIVPVPLPATSTVVLGCTVQAITFSVSTKAPAIPVAVRGR